MDTFLLERRFTKCEPTFAKLFANQDFLRTIADQKHLYLQPATNQLADDGT